jgi:hypothetical protein
MDRCTDEQTDKEADGLTDTWMDRWTDGHTVREIKTDSDIKKQSEGERTIKTGSERNTQSN